MDVCEHTPHHGLAWWLFKSHAIRAAGGQPGLHLLNESCGQGEVKARLWEPTPTMVAIEGKTRRLAKGTQAAMLTNINRTDAKLGSTETEGRHNHKLRWCCTAGETRHEAVDGADGLTWVVKKGGRGAERVGGSSSLARPGGPALIPD